MTTRRALLTLLGGAAAVWPVGVSAQPRLRRIGVLTGYAEDNAEGQRYVVAFRDELQKLGWVEGRNVHIELRWAVPDRATFRRLAIELVTLQPEAILAANTLATTVLQQQTTTIPIVFAAVSDPIGSGFVASYARPGGNITGFTVLEGSLGGKWLELLKEVAPRIETTAFLFDPSSAPFQYFLGPLKKAAAAFAVEPIEASVQNGSELETVIAGVASKSNSSLIVQPGPFSSTYRAEIISLAARRRLPAVYPYRYLSKAGGLLSYGNDVSENFRHAASYIDRILKGEKPSDLPVQAPAKYELVINLKTAKALGIDVPLLMQQRAEEVIE
jgi:putative ABC transport system substrate-binding protein